jgi:hypothetical protein
MLFAGGLVTVKLRVVEPFNGIVVAPNPMLRVGAVAELSVADAVLPVPPFVEVTAPVVLTNAPARVVVTLTVTVQEELAATVPPVRLEEPEPATAVAVPPHVFVSPFGVATTRPAGNVSLNASPVRATALAAGLVMVNESVVVPLGGRLATPKAFAMLGGATTARLAEAVPPVPPCVEVTLPVVLFCVPGAVPVTFTENVQDEL